MDAAYVKMTCAIEHDGNPVSLREGEAWEAGDPVVKANPDLFESRPVALRTSVQPAERTTGPNVERATRAPGERRTGRSRG